MIEATVFNTWCYGTSIKNLNSNKLNIGVFNPEGVEILQESKDIDLTVVYIIAKDKVRLLRQLNREENPDCDEIIRRYTTDAIDLAPDQINFWHLDIHNDKDTIANTAALIIKQIYEYELKYYLIRAE